MPEVNLKFTTNTAQASRGVDKIKGSLEGLKKAGASFGSALKTGLKALTAGLTAAGLAAAKGVKDIIDYAGEVKDISDSTGISIKRLIQLREQFREAGVDGSKLQFVLAALATKLEDPDETTAGWLEKWMLDAEELQGMGIEEQFEVIRAKIGDMASEAERLSASKDFFGKQGANLSRLFSDSESTLNADKMLGNLPQTMQQIAGVLESAGDKFDGLSVKWNQFFSGFASQLLGPIEQAAGIVEKLDLTALGVRAGMFVNGLIQAFKDGTLIETIGGVILSGLIRVAAELTSILSFVIYKAFAASVNMLSSKYPGFSKFVGQTADDTKSYDPLEGYRKDIDKLTGINTNQTLSEGSGSIETAKFPDFHAEFMEMLAPMKVLADALLAPAMKLAEGQYKGTADKHFTAEEWATMIATNIAKVSKAKSIADAKAASDATLHDDVYAAMTGIKDSASIFFNSEVINKDKKVDSAFQDMIPVVSSLAKIGGSRGESNSVANFQKSSLMYQKAIAENTAKMTAGAVIG